MNFSQSVSRDYGVKVSMDGIADDGEYLGQPGLSDNDEHDNVMPDVENAVGTYGPDVLVGSSAANTLIGFKGKDTISGGDGNDTLRIQNGVPSYATDGLDTGDDILDGGAGTDVLRGFGGADTVTSRDGEADDVACGDKVDTETGDTLDTINADCETSDVLFVAAPAGPGPPAGGATPAAPATPPPAIPGTPVVAKPTFASLVTLPAISKSHQSVSRRLFRIRLTKPKNDTILSAVVVLNGKTLKTLKGKRVTSVIDLRGLPKGHFTVKVTLKLKSRATVSGTRAYPDVRVEEVRHHTGLVQRSRVCLCFAAQVR